MKVILLEDVKALGKKGQVVNVSDGYARNLLLPKKLGVEATGKNMNDLKLQKAHEDKVAQENLDAAKAFAEELKDKQVTVGIKVGEGSDPSLQKRLRRRQRHSLDMNWTKRNCSFQLRSKSWVQLWCQSSYTRR